MQNRPSNLYNVRVAKEFPYVAGAQGWYNILYTLLVRAVDRDGRSRVGMKCGGTTQVEWQVHAGFVITGSPDADG